MDTKLLIIILTLPILLLGLGHNLARIEVIQQGSIQSYRPPARTSQATLDKPTTSPFYLAARDEQKKECLWVGICK